MPCETPYLSIVAVSRNDDHGGKLLGRMQIFIDCLSEQVNRFQVPVELVLVEWNPPLDRPALDKALVWPKTTQYFTVRIITVPPEEHKKFQYSDKLSLFQMIGKNVGIRRAKGQFILATNIDIILSNELIQFIAKRQLELEKFYRVNRIDVDSNVPVGASLEEKLEFCRTHVIRINSKYFLSNISNFKAVFIDVVKKPSLLGYYLKNLFYKLKIPRLHYNACGDFTLMAKDDWLRLCGYPELEMYSLNIDSLFLMAASYSGLREEILHAPLEIYHIEHKIGSGVTPGLGQEILLQRLERDGIPCLTWRDCVNLVQRLKNNGGHERRMVLCNERPWGLESTHLPEKVLGACE